MALCEAVCKDKNLYRQIYKFLLITSSINSYRFTVILSWGMARSELMVGSSIGTLTSL